MTQSRTKESVRDADSVVAGGGRMYDGAGATTGEYNDTDGDANGTTYIKTNLGRVDQVQMSIKVNDPALSTSAVGVEIADCRPAEPSDFNSDTDFVSGTVLFTLVDEDGSGEIADDTAIGGANLEFEYDAVRT